MCVFHWHNVHATQYATTRVPVIRVCTHIERAAINNSNVDADRRIDWAISTAILVWCDNIIDDKRPKPPPQQPIWNIQLDKHIYQMHWLYLMRMAPLMDNSVNCQMGYFAVAAPKTVRQTISPDPLCRAAHATTLRTHFWCPRIFSHRNRIGQCWSNRMALQRQDRKINSKIIIRCYLGVSGVNYLRYIGWSMRAPHSWEF